MLYLSSDKLRAELGKGIDDQSIHSLVFGQIKTRTEIALRRGDSVLIDATHIRKKWRSANIELGRRLGAFIVAHVFKVDRETAIKRIAERVSKGGLNVPTDVIDKYISQLELPDTNEFDEVILHL
jgi:predicted kinase